MILVCVWVKTSDAEVDQYKAQAAQELVDKLAAFKAHHSQVTDAAKQQSAEQARRIARIFAQKFSWHATAANEFRVMPVVPNIFTI